MEERVGKFTFSALSFFRPSFTPKIGQITGRKRQVLLAHCQNIAEIKPTRVGFIASTKRGNILCQPRTLPDFCRTSTKFVKYIHRLFELLTRDTIKPCRPHQSRVYNVYEGARVIIFSSISRHLRLFCNILSTTYPFLYYLCRENTYY